jgi:hypothetical protein
VSESVEHLTWHPLIQSDGQEKRKQKASVSHLGIDKHLSLFSIYKIKQSSSHLYLLFN